MPDTLVVDCSVAAKWILPEPDRASALRLLDDYEAGEVTLIAPDLLQAEFVSLLSRRNRRGQLSAEQAQEAFDLMGKCSPRLFETLPRLPLALELSLRYRLSLWDCAYLALAAEHDCQLITADRRLFRGARGRHSLLRLLG
ncbi:MAG TPA: type II toxin-antitoxin system VapC family toxin [Bryobacteraceae bacterium]|nr:type II toxin-antitoxin system VapC family toxin [Bryobacteraceae bacterium]